MDSIRNADTKSINTELALLRFNPELRDRYIIGGLDQNHKLNQPHILDLVTLERMMFQTIPLELTYEPEANWLAIYSPARNTPLYQYTGGEDTLSFTLTFYSNHESRQDVIKKCKWLEALSRNDGFERKPHHLQLSFGDLFKDAKWIMASAKPKYTNFDRDYGMMPRLATVEITLKRLEAGNRTRSQILKHNT